MPVRIPNSARPLLDTKPQAERLLGKPQIHSRGTAMNATAGFNRRIRNGEDAMIESLQRAITLNRAAQRRRANTVTA